MKPATSMLFSLIILAVIMVFTAERLKVLMHGEQPKAQVVDSPSLIDQALDRMILLADTLEREFLSWFKPAPHTDTVVITEDTVIRTYTWVDDYGVRQFSKTEPEGIDAEVILEMAPEYLPERARTPSTREPSPSTPTTTSSTKPSQNATGTASSSPESLSALLKEIPEGEDKTRFMQGLESFKKMQQQTHAQ